jgi:CO dehydrogenase maturation factor
LGKTIAISGKGGTGKSTFSALLVTALMRKGISPLLAVDADPNSTLPEMLGLQADTTIGDLREDTRSIGFREASGVSKVERLECSVHEAVAEGEGFDLVVMGRQEGPGCYCYVNGLLRRLLGELSSSYRRVVVDNEAGMEHISRRTDGKVGTLIVVSDATPTGLRAARRIHELAHHLELDMSDCHLILNRTSTEPDERLTAEIEATGMKVSAFVPYDAAIGEFALDGRPLVDLPSESPAARAVFELADRLDL